MSATQLENARIYLQDVEIARGERESLELSKMEVGLKATSITMISQKDCKIKKTAQLGEHGRGNMQITKTPTLNKNVSV